MSTAAIKINGAAPGSNDDVPLNVLVQLDNSTAESTYAWVMLDRPAGSAAALSNPTIKNPTFTPDCEGTYVLQLVVDAALATQKIDTQVAGVRELKATLERVPGATEALMDDAARGWSPTVNRLLNTLLDSRADPGLLVAYNGSGGALAYGDVVKATSTATLKAGLPGVEYVPSVVKAVATADLSGIPLYVVEGGVDGTAGANAAALIRMRAFGQIRLITGAGGVVGHAVYVSDVARPALTPGTFPRYLGTVQKDNGATFDAMIAGLSDVAGVPDIGSTVLVDAVFGDDALGARQGHPFKTIAPAIAAAISGDIVLVGPGAFTLAAGITVPANVTLRGSGVQRTVVTYSTATDPDVMVTLGLHSYVEDVRLEMTATVGGAFKGIYAAGGRSEVQLRNVIVLVNDTVGGGAVYGIHIIGGGAHNQQLDGALVGVNAFVIGAGIGDKVGLLVGGTNLVTATGCYFFANGGATSEGCKTNHANATLRLIGSTANGTTADTLATAGVIVNLASYMEIAAASALEYLRDPVTAQSAVNARTLAGNLTLLVDPVRGSDTTGSRMGAPFATVAGALGAAGLTAGDVIRLSPGTHTLADIISVPAGVAIVGAGRDFTGLLYAQPDAVKVVITLAGANSFLSDLTVTVSSAFKRACTIVGVPVAACVTRNLRRVGLYFDNFGAAGAGGDVFGVDVMQAGTITPTQLAQLDDCLINIISVNGNKDRAVHVATNAGPGSDPYRIVNSHLHVEGGADAACVETADADSYAIMQGGDCNTPANGSDVLRTGGVLILEGVRLLGPNGAVNKSFQPGARDRITFACTGAPGGGTNYLRALAYIGAADAAESNKNRIYSQQKGVAVQMTVRALTAPGGAVVDTFTLRSDGGDTGLVVTLTGAAVVARTAILSGEVLAEKELSLKVVQGAGSVLADVAVEIDVYYG